MMGERRKVLFVQHSGANGGAPMSLFYLIEFVRKEYDVVVYFISSGPTVKFYRSQGITVHVATSWSKIPHCSAQYHSLNPFKLKFYRDVKAYGIQLMRSLLTYTSVRRALKREKPDIVHLNSSVLLVEGLAVKSMGVPLVWHVREYLELGLFGLRLGWVRRIIQHCADRIVVLSDAEGARVGESDKVHVIPNFVDPRKFNEDQVRPVNLRSQYGLPPRTPVFAMLGWSSPAKGTMVAVQALHFVLGQVSDARLVLFGTGMPPPGGSKKGYGVYRNVQAFVKKHGMQEAVIFAGTAFDIASYIRECDVILVPFVVPHFARPILEAGAMRTVVVTVDLEGPREMVLAGTAGYLAKPGDAHDLADKMIMALQNDNSIMIDCMYRQTMNNYNAERNSQRIIALYKSAMNTHDEAAGSC